MDLAVDEFARRQPRLQQRVRRAVDAQRHVGVRPAAAAPGPQQLVEVEPAEGEFHRGVVRLAPGAFGQAQRSGRDLAPLQRAGVAGEAPRIAGPFQGAAER
ncbi:hypothetical protein GCM10009416_06150 [Craurococcus roseus]|uniref:Uncharacterized protein n=1 Tax=Craurococcus roseus TaxID=77585 RepID=A0ABP3PMI3_9PROT